MQKAPATSVFTKIIRQLFYVLFFLTPLLLWPYTSEVFEFNKMLFVYLMTILISAAWLIKSFVEQEFVLNRTKLDLPIALFLLSQIISTIISINPHTSLWGYYSRFHGGLMSTISYIILFYAFVTHFLNDKKAISHVITAILASAALTSVYAVLEHLGIDKDVWVQDVQNRVFSTLGQPNWLSAYLIALLPLALYKTLDTKSNIDRAIYGSLSLLYLLAILFTKSQSGLGATAIILLVFFIITCIQKKKSWLILSLIPISILLFVFKGQTIKNTFYSLNKINPFYSNTLAIITEENKTRIGGSDSMAIRRVVWEGALKLGLSHPLFGTGVETFGYTYYWVRPAAHNLTSETDFLYNKAHNEYLNFFANSGFLGLGAYLFLIGSILYLFLNKKTEHKELRLPLLLGFFSILITNYFGFSVVNIGLFFFLYPAIYLSFLGKATEKSRRLSFDSTLGVLFVCGLSLWLVINTFRAWSADIAYNRGKTNIEDAQKAVSLNPNEPIYYAQLGNNYAQIAIQYIVPEIAKLPATASAEIKKQAQDYLGNYITMAVDNVTKASNLNPYNLNILKAKARTELKIAEVSSQYNQKALTTLLKITEYAPTDSTNFYNIGILYLGLENKDQAKVAFQKALDLNPGFQAAATLLQTIK